MTLKLTDPLDISFMNDKYNKKSKSLPEVMMADLIAEALQVGFLDLMLPARPETCGHDMEVLVFMLYGEEVPAATMLTPGAAISGYKERIVGLM